jgi:hypothetical protein
VPVDQCVSEDESGCTRSIQRVGPGIVDEVPEFRQD